MEMNKHLGGGGGIGNRNGGKVRKEREKGHFKKKM
jgi:hypothetical protein